MNQQEEFWTDFRVTNDTTVLARFKSVVKAVDDAGYMQWASPSTFKLPQTTTIPASADNAVGSSVPLSDTSKVSPKPQSSFGDRVISNGGMFLVLIAFILYW
ncbi:hypothetical protein BCR33DRAFT_550322 [Rhizoclosmatium globosum]|uniref:Uncharacterized protein n=1 Tax=Rhizoclosmatium globosum TaxID=329046 RepID=A0A1Y2B9J4_9FUNG|nr:hypothetical protein BCR33DRAFT_550322 [Rhizoclosmatium globosum]|eukprot:ORY31157.1 hypothetical protein BCR33DRAFT_550322 [Rhizoclosmatium globosum]